MTVIIKIKLFMSRQELNFLFFFFNDTATTEIYTLSLHDALPISARKGSAELTLALYFGDASPLWDADRKSTRLNSSHVKISYAVFCLKKKKEWSADCDNSSHTI